MLSGFSVEPNPLENGGTATISVEGAEANSTVTVSIDNGGDKTDSVTITTDANGDGSTTWTVPDWILANFNTPGAEEITRSITSQPT